jgi:AraC-like DNA-binding protein
MDALSETLRRVHLSGAIFVSARLTSVWSLETPRTDTLAPLLEPGAERVVLFHMVTKGECWVEIDDLRPVRLTAGDVVILPQGTAHRMTSQLGIPSVTLPLEEILASRPQHLAYGGGGAVTQLVCGYLACEAKLAQMLLSGLPPVVRVNVRGTNAGDWWAASAKFALAEARSPRPGGAGMLSKLAEVLFVEALRQYMRSPGAESTGWLAGARDRIVGAALGALHGSPGHGWTVEELAQTAGASRSVLAERFQRLMGVSPMQYLTQWRMVRAAELLRHSSLQLTHVAQEVGYRTDTAFSRAFRREFGQPPATWRRSRAVEAKAAIVAAR